MSVLESDDALDEGRALLRAVSPPAGSAADFRFSVLDMDHSRLQNGSVPTHASTSIALEKLFFTRKSAQRWGMYGIGGEIGFQVHIGIGVQFDAMHGQVRG